MDETTHSAPSSNKRSPDTPPDAAHEFFVVGLGASAGGLEALDCYFAALPPQPEAAFVVVQHLSPDHKSMMADLLSRHTTMPVCVAEHGLRVEPGHVYVIPPGMTMGIAGGRLQLTPKPTHGLSLPIDHFFYCMGRELGPAAVAVVLSGTGSDGSHGVLAVHDGGGTVLVQQPETAKFDGMPRAALATGIVDAVLSPSELAEETMRRLSAGIAAKLADGGVSPDMGLDEAIPAILKVLQARTGIDFRDYKVNTLRRRVERRMRAVGNVTAQDYLERLSTDATEQTDLRRELLIPVTSFFRDEPAFENLRQRVLEPLVRNAEPGRELRAWCVGIATGEEPYSLAILMSETIAALRPGLSFKIFATDAEPNYVEQASVGHFAGASADNVSRERQERFFVRSGEDGWHVRPELRQRIVFARHNVLSDPPFTQIDLLVCRNVLIYFKPDAQERALRRLQFALRVGGVLFLGPSESLGRMTADFGVVDGHHKIFRLVARPPLLPAEDVLAGIPRSLPRRDGRRGSTHVAPESEAVESAYRCLVESYAPASLLVSSSRELIHVFGNARRFLAFNEGSATLDVLHLLPREMSTIVAALLFSAHRERTPQRSTSVEVALGADGAAKERFHVSVRPVADITRGDAYLVSFEPARPWPPDSALPEVADIASIERERVDALERELTSMRAGLETSIQELATANEEFQATNEELMAANEELQSTNEELQSVNEELHTLNSEYQEKIDQLNLANADLDALSRASKVPTLFVDARLSLVRFTEEAAGLFRIRMADIGRPLQDLTNRLDYPDLFEDLRAALDARQERSREVTSQDGRQYLARVLAVPSEIPELSRAVVTFVDVSHLKDAQHLQAVIDALPSQLAVLDNIGTITMVNRAWRAFAQANGDLALRHTGPGTNYLRVCSVPGETTAMDALKGIRAVLDGLLPAFTMRYPCDSPTEKRWFVMHVAPLTGPDTGCVISHTNVTNWSLESTMVPSSLPPVP